jgi:regulator of protease activity HflC (stomatin/prohibitin superfamily)
MFERLIDLLVEFVELFQIFIYVDHFNRAVILRFGKYHRTVGPGLRFILPLGMEDVIDVNVKPEPQYIDLQSAHSKDDYLLNVQVGYSLRVEDPKTFLLEYEDTDDLIALLIADLVREAIESHTWKEIHSGVWTKGLRMKANKKARKRGAYIDELIIQDLANGDANRLWIEGVEL